MRHSGLVLAVAGAAACLMVLVLLLPPASLRWRRWTGSSLFDDDKPPGAQLGCTDPSIAKMPFCDTKLPLEKRVQDLLSRMSLEEKVSQLGTLAPAVSSVGLPAYQYWSESLHGVAYSPGVSFNGNITAATSFPQTILLGATFNKRLFAAVGEAISTEARAIANDGRAGLTYFTPNINIVRDPRWGRGQETPGEDPHLASVYAEQFVRAMQGHSPYLKTVTTCKHFAAYDLEDWGGVDRFHFNAEVTAQDMLETYLPPFEACVVRGGAASIMCSYNAVNGIPACANHVLLNDLARGNWSFQGYVVSDCGAVRCIQDTHHYTKSESDTCAVTLRGGCDLDCGDFLQGYTAQAVRDNTIEERDVDTALSRVLATRFRLGLFDARTHQPYRALGSEAVDTPEHQALALQVAHEGIVLLKNLDQSLPLDQQQVRSIAVIGPNADNGGTMQGNYYGRAPFLTTPVLGLREYAKVVYEKGCDINSQDREGFAAAIQAAAQTDVTVLVMGLDQSEERETVDRTHLRLPGVQHELIDQVAAAAKGVVILVIMAGSSIDVSASKHSNNVSAILWVGYPGQAGGKALADILFGAYNPAGRLPFTMYPAEYVDQVSMFDMNMRGNPGRTYRFYQNKPVYPFGHGLSYTTFQYTWEEDEGHALPLVIMDTDDLRSRNPFRTRSISILVSNVGTRPGDDVVMLYVKRTDSQEGDQHANSELKGFERVHLLPGSSLKLTFELTTELFTVATRDGARQLTRSKWLIQVGPLQQEVYLDPLFIDTLFELPDELAMSQAKSHVAGQENHMHE
eukprot:jgi/Chlat1/4151/Chrsp27S04230